MYGCTQESPNEYKHRFDTQADAEIRAMHWERIFGQPIFIIECVGPGNCGGWHLGSGHCEYPGLDVVLLEHH